MASLDASDAPALLSFLRAAEALKDETRTAWTSQGRTESVAAHTWRLCLWAVVLADYFDERFDDFDTARLLRICVVHDLGEAIRGDVPAIHQSGDGKAEAERADLLTLLDDLPAGRREDVLALWDEYEEAATPEARVAKALDKLETILQHNQGANPDDFDYAFNLGYGTEYTDDLDPLVTELRRVLDAETQAQADGQNGGDSERR